VLGHRVQLNTGNFAASAVRIVFSNSSAQWGGVHVMTELLARGLSQRGHEVTIFGARNSMLEERMRGIAPFEPILHGMDLHPRTVWRAASALRRHRVDVVLALMKKDVRLTVPAASLLRIPSVVRHPNDRPLKGWIYDRALFGALPALHVANSFATRSTLVDSAPWLDPARVVVIHNGVDPANVDSAVPAELGLPPASLVVGFAGRLEERKGLYDLIAAWPRIMEAVPHARLVIAGRGRDEAKAWEQSSGMSGIHWLGYRSDVPSVLHSVDIAVVPSHWEGFGIIAAEAMLARLPVVAANASSLPEIIRDGQEGLLVPPRDPAALADAVIRLARDPGLRKKLGEAGRSRVLTEFSAMRMVDSFEKVLRSVVKA
jgi:glycosyltransferase involved in cell wall biosynthesis